MGSPHDKLFKKSFENLAVAAAHFRDSLPAETVPLLDLAKLRLESGSYVDEELRDRHSDLLFSVPWVGPAMEEQPPNEPDSALMYLLFEQQSTVDTMMPLRMLR